jgi:hypothetical protein
VPSRLRRIRHGSDRGPKVAPIHRANGTRGANLPPGLEALSTRPDSSGRLDHNQEDGGHVRSDPACSSHLRLPEVASLSLRLAYELAYPAASSLRATDSARDESGGARARRRHPRELGLPSGERAKESVLGTRAPALRRAWGLALLRSSYRLDVEVATSRFTTAPERCLPAASASALEQSARRRIRRRIVCKPS